MKWNDKELARLEEAIERLGDCHKLLTAVKGGSIGAARALAQECHMLPHEGHVIKVRVEEFIAAVIDDDETVDLANPAGEQ